MIETLEYHGWKIHWTGWQLTPAYTLRAYWIADKGESRIFSGGKYIATLWVGVRPTDWLDGESLFTVNTPKVEKFAYEVRALERLLDHIYEANKKEESKQ